MPVPAMNAAELGLESQLMQEQLNLNTPALHEFLVSNLPLVNEDQRAAYDSIVSAFAGDRGGCFFINGPGGTEKTF